MNGERTVDEIAQDPKILRFFIGVREDIAPDGRKFGVLVAKGEHGPVYKRIKEDELVYGGKYYLCFPIEPEDKTRCVWPIGGNI